MSDPITSQYDQHPFDPNDHSHDNDPPPNLGNTDSPELKVAWDKRPSFNAAPKDIKEGNGGNAETKDAGGDAQDFSVNFGTLGTQVTSMLNQAKSLVTQYESLRTHVLASEGSVFGQNSMLPGTKGIYDSWSHTWTAGDDTPSPTVFAEPAKEFAAKMNPAQEKGLQGIGAALELVGEYIALVNHSGQVYSAADRQSLFPAPPSKGVTG
ncbi:hypothetical protein [Actinoallomurus sp. CA-142502]|uniref:hypothetical protein n=1 Tax=Actinoallomurus sp. CA-142502 TaxID=3239885 RepID=UPI003D90B841